jgi:hypothetical protein
MAKDRNDECQICPNIWGKQQEKLDLKAFRGNRFAVKELSWPKLSETSHLSS